MAVISNNVVSFDYNLKNTTIKKLSKIYCNVGINFVTQRIKPDQVAATLAKKRKLKNEKNISSWHFCYGHRCGDLKYPCPVSSWRLANVGCIYISNSIPNYRCYEPCLRRIRRSAYSFSGVFRWRNMFTDRNTSHTTGRRLHLPRRNAKGCSRIRFSISYSPNARRPNL